MTAVPTWGERLRGWLAAVIDLWRIAFPQFRIAWDTSTYVFLEQLDKAYQALPEAERNDPRIKANYDAARAVLPKSKDNVIDVAKSAAEGVGQYITDTFMKLDVVPISQSFKAATTLVALDAAKDVTIGLAGLATEVVSAGQFDTFTDFFKFLRAKTGYGGVMTMLMKSPLEMGLIRPLSYHLHDTFRNELPDGMKIWMGIQRRDYTETQAVSWFNGSIFGEGKDVGSMEEIFSTIEGYKGTPAWMAGIMWEGRYMEPRMRDFMMATGDYLFDEDWLDFTLDRMMVDPRDRVTYKTFLREKYLKPYRDRVAAQLRNMRKEGYISAQDFRVKLAETGVPLLVRGMLEKEADMLFTVDMRADQISAWEAQYLKTPSMTDAELRALYATIIVDPARIEPRIAKMRAQRSRTAALPKPATQGAKVSSKPSWSAISLDFVGTGKLTPETVETTPGRHTITVSADGYEPYEEEIRVGEGEFVEIYAALVPE